MKAFIETLLAWLQATAIIVEACAQCERGLIAAFGMLGACPGKLG
jgi:hypothetical protein